MDLSEAVIAAALRDPPTLGPRHHLIFGPRGVGKTTVLRALGRRLRADRRLRERAWVIAPTRRVRPTSVVQLLGQVLGALPDDPELGPSAEALRSLQRQRDGDREQRALELIRARLGERALVISIEHLDELLDALGRAGQQRLRVLLDDSPAWSILATARTRCQALLADGAPLHGVFAPCSLEALTPEQCRELLARLAETNHRSALSEQLRSDRGLARVRAIHHLVGGTPRAMTLVARELDVEGFDHFEHQLARLAHDLEPHLREQLPRLSPSQRGIVELLAESWRPLTVTEIAEQTFAKQASVSGALRHLRRDELVSALEVGRERYYELSEALDRLARHQPERLGFARALRRWFADERPPAPALVDACAGSSHEHDEARAILAQAPQIAVGRLRGRLVRDKSPVMTAALALALERNAQVDEALELLRSTPAHTARRTHAALIRLAHASSTSLARIVGAVTNAEQRPDDPDVRAALLQTFDEAAPAHLRALSDIALRSSIITGWTAAEAWPALGRLLHRLRPTRQNPGFETQLIAALESAWHHGQLAQLLPPELGVDGILASASARARAFIAYASVTVLASPCHQPDPDELRRRLGVDPSAPAWPTLETCAELGPAQCALVLDLLACEASFGAWTHATSPDELAAVAELVFAPGLYAWIASRRALAPLVELGRRLSAQGRRLELPHALLASKSPREAVARLSAGERALVRLILRRHADHRALARIPRQAGTQ